MKTNHVISAMMGAALLGGAAFAEPDAPQGQGPRGDRPGFRAEGPARERMQQRGPGPEGACPMMGKGSGPEGGCPGLQRGGRGPEGGPRGLPGPQRLKEAGATEQQLEALKKFEDEQQLKRIDQKAAAEKAEVAFQQLMRSETVDEAAVLKAADALSQARAEAFKADIASQLKVRAILGADVLKKMREMGPPEGMGRPGRGPLPEGQGQGQGQGQPRRERNAPPAGDRPQARE